MPQSSSIRVRFLILIVIAFGALAPVWAAAQTRAFLKLAGVQGESAQRAGEIDVQSFSIGVSCAPMAKAELKNLRIVKAVDSTTPRLGDACFAGQQIATAVLTVPAADGTPLMTYTLTNATVRSVTTSAGGSLGGGAPVDEVELSYASIKTAYRGSSSSSSGGGGSPTDGASGHIESAAPRGLTPVDPAPPTTRRKGT